MTRALLLAPFLAFLAACSKPEPLTEVQIHRETIPDVLLTCADSPSIPPKPRDQEAVGRYIVALHEAHADCMSKLEAVRELQRP